MSKRLQSETPKLLYEVAIGPVRARIFVFFSCYSVYQVLPGFSLQLTFSVSGFRDAFGGLRAIIRGRNRWIRVLRSRGS